jgi:ABC-2 type transport system ATP-binding protein
MVGYMPDSFGVYDNMSLHEYLDFFGAAYRIPRSRRAADRGSARRRRASQFRDLYVGPATA